MRTANRWISSYFDAEANRASKQTFAYPAYDRYDSGSADDELNDGDLMAPALLNVRPSIAAFYGLQAIRGQLEEGLAATATAVSLRSAVHDGSLKDRIRPFVGMLDSGAPHGVQLTTLTKVLHRKRPTFMPLHDRYVRACYLGADAPYPLRRTKSRTWVDYWAAMMVAIHDDLESQADEWADLARLAGDLVSSLRVLDVVAWNAGRTLDA